MAAPRGTASLDTVRVCPRCSYHGTSVSYFSTGSHILALLGLTVFTGFGGLVYLLLRGGERICPQCGLKWGRGGYLAPVAPNAMGAHDMAPALGRMSDGGAKRGWAWALWVFAAIMIVAGIGDLEAVPVMFGLLAAGGGYLLRRSGNEDRERRREALLQSLHLPVLRLAAQHGGRLTVSQVAQDLGWTLPRAEKVLQSMEDGYRVMGDVTPQGVIVYDFPELMQMQTPAPRAEAPLANPAAPVPPAPRLMA